MRTSIYAGSLVALLLVHAAIVRSAMPEPLPRRAPAPAAPLAHAAERCDGAGLAACAHAPGPGAAGTSVTELAGER